jgi:hypothetical protein
MKNYVILIIVLLLGLPALARDKSNTVSPSLDVQPVSRNFKLEQIAFARSKRLKSILNPDTRAKLDPVTERLLGHLATNSRKVDLDSLVQQEIRSKYPKISNEQPNLLSFYVFAEAARIISVQDDLKNKLDGLNEMSEMNSLRLQMTMDRRSKFISTLSNIMKKISTTQDTLVQNIK